MCEPVGGTREGIYNVSFGSGCAVVVRAMREVRVGGAGDWGLCLTFTVTLTDSSIIIQMEAVEGARGGQSWLSGWEEEVHVVGTGARGHWKQHNTPCLSCRCGGKFLS